MKLSREWLGDFTKISASDKDYADRMTMSGSKVEGTLITGEEISGVVAGKVLEMERHPDSDHLWIARVDVGRSASLTIVTGAQNVSVGDLVPVATDGSTLPGGVTIRDGVLRGVASQGMLCSLKELGLDAHDYPYAIEDGIFIMQEPCAPGDDIKSVLGLGVSVVDFEITNNRPDCLSVIGLARESAATFNTELFLTKPVVKEKDGNIDDHLRVTVADEALCPRYSARMVKNVRIAPSPAWMRRRLRESGVRPINNIVDITNYVMLEYGQPMHAFDFSCVGEGHIVVRRAASGETLETLDGTARTLTPDMLVIADETKPIGVAGVMGGANSEITGETTTIVFESANFSGPSIRKTSLALAMRTDASGRFEKGLDPENTLSALERACQLVELLDAGDVVRGVIDCAAPKSESRTLPLEVERVNALLGTDASREFMIETLEKLGFSVSGDTITVPSWRADVTHFADISEEIARFYGYDVIAPTLFKGSASGTGYTEKQKFEKDLGTVCRGMGYYEIMTYSFGSAAAWDQIRLPEDSPLRRAYHIQNPLGEDTSVMRTTALPTLLGALALNLSRRNLDLKLYELASIYLPVEGQTLADERMVLTLGACGKNAGFYHVKGAVEALLRSVRVSNAAFEPVCNNPSYHPGRCAEVYVDGRKIGVVGQVHPLTAENFGIEAEIYAAELDLGLLFAAKGAEPTYIPLPRFPAVTRDLAVVVDAGVPAARLSACILEAGAPTLKRCELFDVYTGAPIPEGKKSAAFSLVLRADNATLTDEHADRTVAAVIAALGEKYGASIR